MTGYSQNMFSQAIDVLAIKLASDFSIQWVGLYGGPVKDEGV